MDMGMIVFAVCYFTCLLVCYNMLANERKPKKNIILGVTVPREYHDSEAVERICARYHKRLRLAALFLALPGVAACLMPLASVQMAVCMAGILAMLVGMYVVYIHGHRQLMAEKRWGGWRGSRWATTATDLRAMEEKNRPLPLAWLIAPCVLGAVPPVCGAVLAARGDALWILVICLAAVACGPVLILAYAMAIRRQPAEVVGQQSDLNVILTRVRRREYLRCMLMASWLMAVMNGSILLGLLDLAPGLLFLPVTLILSAAVAIYTIRAEFAVRRVQEKFTIMAGDSLAVDDDENWFWGMFYYNRRDPKLMVKSRVGSKMTFNFARPLGLVIMLASGLVILLLPLLGIWFVAEELTPITYSVEGHAVTAAHTGERVIDLGADYSWTILEDWPDGVRMAGTSIGALRKGQFDVSGVGMCYVLVHVDEMPLLLLTAEDGRMYLFNYAAVFDQLLIG